MHEAVPAIAGCGVSPVVRLPDMQGWMIKRKSNHEPNVRTLPSNAERLLGALDAGAHGVSQEPNQVQNHD